MREGGMCLRGSLERGSHARTSSLERADWTPGWRKKRIT